MQLACIDKKREAAKHYNIKTMCIQASPTAPDSDEIAADQKKQRGKQYWQIEQSTSTQAS